jgi:patatin-related protein
VGASERVEYQATSEVRYAVVLYGGVSLAIYMNGIVQELLQLVRATAPDPRDETRLWWSDAELTGAGPVYRKLGRLLDRSRLGDGSGPVRTRFVVDIVTGTSAGGINGVFLAKALAMDQDLSALSNLWVDQGDIALLLNDDDAAKQAQLEPQHPPLSLLSGKNMLYQLLKALDGVSQSQPRAEVAPRSPYANQIDLWITATDLQGRPVSVATYNPERLGDIREDNHRTTFHFRYDATNVLLDTGDTDPDANTFARKYDPMLAFAARCTSSFPAAFQAVELSDLDEVKARVSATSNGPDWTAGSELDQFFVDYGGVGPAMLHSFADGGYLDNQPVDLVMQTLPKRRAALPVARRVLLVDPNPGGGPQRTSRAPDAIPPPDVTLTGDRVDLLGTLTKVVSLPRVQTIGGDVEKILALREPCRIRADVYAAIDEALDNAEAPPDGAEPAPTSPSRAAYEALRRAVAASDVGEAIARIGFPAQSYPAGSQHHAIATRLVGAWQRAGGGGSSDNFLASLDLGFELRKINFLQGRIGRAMKKTDVGPEDVLQQAALRRGLDKAYVDVAARARNLRYRRPSPEAPIAALQNELGRLELDVNFGAPPAEIDDALAARLQPGATLRTVLDTVMSNFGDQLKLADTERQIGAAVKGTPTWSGPASGSKPSTRPPFRSRICSPARTTTSRSYASVRVTPTGSSTTTCGDRSWRARRSTTSAASSAPTGAATTSCGAGWTPPSASSARCGPASTTPRSRTPRSRRSAREPRTSATR